MPVICLFLEPFYIYWMEKIIKNLVKKMNKNNQNRGSLSVWALSQFTIIYHPSYECIDFHFLGEFGQREQWQSKEILYSK